jgi:glutamate racemase
MSKVNSSPIGVFDSGIGGLTVLREITRLLPEEDTVYLGDTARVPYGTKSGETVVRYSEEDAEFLSGFAIKLLVVACNTASAHAIEELTERFDVPVIGVIEPGARAAVEATSANRVGVIGTEGTIRSSAYCRAIKAVKPSIETITAPCPLFVPLAEEGWVDNDVARLVASHYLEGMKGAGVDTLVLGCTHYPLLKKTISLTMGPGVTLIDSAEATALEVVRVMDENGLRRKDAAMEAGGVGGRGGEGGTHRFFVTDSPERFVKVGQVFFGARLTEAELARL